MTPIEWSKALGLLYTGLTQEEVFLECSRSRAAITKLAKKAREMGRRGLSRPSLREGRKAWQTDCRQSSMPRRATPSIKES